MAGIIISKSFKLKLPEDQRDNLEENLWVLSGGICQLCGEPLNRTSDTIEADHDVAEVNGGANSIENIQLAHKACNQAKGKNPTVKIRPYLRLAAFIKKASVKENVRYGECAGHFGIVPVPIHLTIIEENIKKIKFELPDGSSPECQVFQQENASGNFEYCYVQLPRSAIFNDDACQPRNVKISQAWAIYCDLQKNPLHEPPGCRLEYVSKDVHRILMFDGQHKTVASWMCGYETVVVKLYLNMSLQQATALVNSIQAKIKKLPLSPFEIAGKLGDEWGHKWADYEEVTGSDDASEAGFIKWLHPNDRKRGEQAFKEGRVKQLLERDDLLLLQHVKRTPNDNGSIPEASFKNKLLVEFIYAKPLKATGEAGELLRSHEADNIVKIMNHFTVKVFEPSEGFDVLTDEQLETKRRFVYQGSLKFFADMARRIVNNFCVTDNGLEFIEAKIDQEKWVKISASIDRLVGHPIWHEDFELSNKTKSVREALLKNQNVKEVLKDVGLTPGYILGAEDLSGNWFK